MAVSSYLAFILCRNLTLPRSDWTLDVTHPGVDAEEGWQYAHTFTDPDDQWTAEQPPQLERLLTGNGAVTAGLTSPTRSNNRSRSGSSASLSHPQTWVRRRRWVRVMRRRLDIPPLPFLEPDGSMYHLDADGTLIPYVDENRSDFGDDIDGVGQEMGVMPSSFISGAQDYVARARYLVGTKSRDTDADGGVMSAVDARRAIAKLERATTELRQGILGKFLKSPHTFVPLTFLFVGTGDEDFERRTQAEVLLHAYSRELERRRLAAGAQGLLISEDGSSTYFYVN